MAIFPCAQKGLCVDPSTPFINASAELPDQEIFVGFSTGFGPSYPPLGSDFFAAGCTTFCESTTSQADADACAERGNVDCLSVAWPTAVLGADIFGNPVPIYQRRTVYRNGAQSASVACPDGNEFVYTVPANKYSAFSQSIADNAAISDAQQNAPEFQVCIGNLSKTQICPNVPYSDSVTATGNHLTAESACWSIIGSLPPGVHTDLTNADSCFTGSLTLNFSGTPTTPGTYSFAIEIQDALGDFMVKPVTIRVMGISGVNPMPDAPIGAIYHQFLTPIATTNPIYSLEAGALPDGLSLDSTGVIFGTPTVANTFDFTLGITEAGTGLTCLIPAEIKVTSNFNWRNQMLYIAVVGSADTVFNIADGSQPSIDGSLVHNTVSTDICQTVVPGEFPYSGAPLVGNLKIDYVFNQGVSAWTVFYWDNKDPLLGDPPTSTFTGNVTGTFNFPITMTGGPGGKLFFALQLVTDNPGAPVGTNKVTATLTPRM